MSAVGQPLQVGDPAEEQAAAFARDVQAGLQASPKYLPCCYFYDREGSRLFEEICALPEYYLWRAERQILAAHAAALAAGFAQGVTLVDLGSGNATKTRMLIEALLRRHGTLRYVPVDVSRAALEESVTALRQAYPALEVTPVGGTYEDALRHVRAEAGEPTLVLWLGSSIGNLERHEAAAFLARAGRALAAADRLLVGIDLRKDPAVLERAYNDAAGVTARFNLNLFSRINRELGGRFNLDAFAHRAVYDAEAGRIEMCLVSTRDQWVPIDLLGLRIRFRAGEAVHTENSYKYSFAEIDALAAGARLRVKGWWVDAEERFRLTLFAPPG